MMLLYATPAVYGATGDLVSAVILHSTGLNGFACNGGAGLGITFDGTNLWYSCYEGPTLMKADPVSGAVIATYDTAVSTYGHAELGAIAYDATRNVIWAGNRVSYNWGVNGQAPPSITKIALDASKNVTGSAITFAVPEAAAESCSFASRLTPNGLAIDGVADILYVSYDCATNIYRYAAVTGAFLGSLPTARSSADQQQSKLLGLQIHPPTPRPCPQPTVVGDLQSDVRGLAVGGNLLFQAIYQFLETSSVTPLCGTLPTTLPSVRYQVLDTLVVDKTTLAYAFAFFDVRLAIFTSGEQLE